MKNDYIMTTIVVNVQTIGRLALLIQTKSTVSDKRNPLFFLQHFFLEIKAFAHMATI